MQSRRLRIQIGNPNRPSARPRVLIDKLLPIVPGRTFLRILRRNQFEIRPVGKTRQRHFAESIRMLTAVFGANPRGSELLAQNVQIASGNGDMVNLKIGGASGTRYKEYGEFSNHVIPSLYKLVCSMLKLIPFFLASALMAEAATTDVVILGSGTPRADPDRSGPAVAVIYQGKAYLFDSGPGVVRRASAAAAKLHIDALLMPNLHRVFLTHLHSDHTLGLPDLIFSPWVLHRSMPLEIYGPKGTKAMVDHIEAAWQPDIEIRVHGLEHGNTTGYQANVHEIAPGVVFSAGGLEITALPVQHAAWPQAFGYLIKTPDRTIVISGDCAPSPAILEACHGCDVLLHEVYSMSELKIQRVDWPEYLHQAHTSTEELGKIAAQTKPKMLVLYHQLMTDTTDAQLVNEVKTGAETKVFSSRDFDVY